MITLAMDIGGTKLAAALVDSALQIIARREIPTPASQTPDALEAALRDLVTPLWPQAQQFAIASTGIIQHGVLTSINPCNLGGLSHFPLVDVLTTLTGLPGVALNDVMTDLQKSSVSLQMGIQVRNKLVTAYQEMMSMQV